ncbi:NAD(P)-binding protein [Laetiporus sulphureus 93-53]|uniref:NAD(P)-binding protein n=1 Tax=Laetiporus sulphureus 93-53 TaxID=1314785 RepID=A0A165DE73_9APHY|nr:NAD(P)-binding protein [Laetiporus sulphureus 93-53]KZT04685.1 NAD(P)-binding protein [Laetiporus sulphureus 93-53]
MQPPQVWFITGASSGFGRCMTDIVLRNGDIAVSTLRKPEVLADLARAYPEDRLLILKLDVTKPQEIQDYFAEAERKCGRIDVVFDNAGYGIIGEIESTPEHIARELFDVDFWGAVNVNKEAIRVFRDVNQPRGGKLLQMSSRCGVEGGPLIGFYHAAKFAFEGFSESLAAELDPEWNIQITLIEPGYFYTGSVGHAVRVPLHPAYSNPALPATTLRGFIDGGPAGGDAMKATTMMYRLASLPLLPLQFPLGQDALETIKRKTTRLITDTSEYEAWSKGLERDS